MNAGFCTGTIWTLSIISALPYLSWKTSGDSQRGRRQVRIQADLRLAGQNLDRRLLGLGVRVPQANTQRWDNSSPGHGLDEGGVSMARRRVHLNPVTDAANAIGVPPSIVRRRNLQIVHSVGNLPESRKPLPPRAVDYVAQLRCSLANLIGMRIGGLVRLETGLRCDR
jgi:hypothetical protein